MKVKVSTVAFSKNDDLVKCLLENFPTAEVNQERRRITAEELPEYFARCEGIIVGLEHVTPTLLDSLPDLRIVTKYGVGLDNIDFDACEDRNIRVAWTGGVSITPRSHCSGGLAAPPVPYKLLMASTRSVPKEVTYSCHRPVSV